MQHALVGETESGSAEQIPIQPMARPVVQVPEQSPAQSAARSSAQRPAGPPGQIDWYYVTENESVELVTK